MIKQQYIYLNFLDQPRSTTELSSHWLICSINYLVKTKVYFIDKPNEKVIFNIYLYADSIIEAIDLVKNYFSHITRENISNYEIFETKPLN